MTEPSGDWDLLVSRSRILLQGFIDESSPHGLPIHKYLDQKIDSVLINKCRTALAEVILSGRAPADICRLLAELIVPDETEDAAERQIEFKFRKRGQRRQHMRNTEIVGRVYRAVQLGKSVEDAIWAVHQEVGLSEFMINNLWDRYKIYRDKGLI